MNNKIGLNFCILIFFFCLPTLVFSQTEDSTDIKNSILDSLFIQEVENKHKTDKVLHAEPLFIDLIRDLGARKGEKEWNVGLGLTDQNSYSYYTTLVEYEFAPIDRLGVEIELPFTFYYPNEKNGAAPKSKMNSIKLASQYSFFVSEKLKTSMAIGYIHEFDLKDFSRYGKENVYKGNVYNPFFIAAKRWGNNFHTLLYTGPQLFQEINHSAIHVNWQINSNLHYMIPGTRNFIGLELNKNLMDNDFDMTIRPQMRVSVADNLMVGIITGIPIYREKERFSTFLRIIYEPGTKRH
jgi:hypothetical protein